MIIDGQLLFTGTSNGATGGVTSSAYTDTVAQAAGTYVCSNIIDLGVLSGVPSSASGGGARDLASATKNPRFLCRVLSALTSGGSATLQVEIDGAPDNGSGAPGSYTVMWQSQVLAYTALTAGIDIGNIDMPRPAPGQAIPRYLRVRFIVATATITAGTIEASLVIDRDDQPVGTTGALSGYPAGITVAN